MDGKLVSIADERSWLALETSVSQSALMAAACGVCAVLRAGVSACVGVVPTALFASRVFCIAWATRREHITPRCSCCSSVKHIPARRLSGCRHTRAYGQGTCGCAQSGATRQKRKSGNFMTVK